MLMSDVVHSHIPRGIKTDVFCILNNEDNVQRRTAGLKGIYDDDCGVWGSEQGKTVRHPYIALCGGVYKRLFLKDGIYTMEKFITGKRMYITLQQQPNAMFSLFADTTSNKKGTTRTRGASPGWMKPLQESTPLSSTWVNRCCRCRMVTQKHRRSPSDELHTRLYSKPASISILIIYVEILSLLISSIYNPVNVL